MVDTQQGKQPMIVWLLFRKGGNFTESQINTLLANKPQQFKEYERSGKFQVGYINIE
ncbi:MAG: hypothetical protein HGA85_04165 [Nanoarchaeota archaeon]|nr:hypothetical protein [Nanoarchaeota archaeon]